MLSHSTAPARLCSIPSCGRKHYGLGLCDPHYKRRRRGQDMSFPIGDRFWSAIDKNGPGGCWLWTGAKSERGYGVLNKIYAHRIAYELLVGPIPPNLEIDHLCRVHACVYPRHLEAVPHKENLRRGHSPTAINARKTHCIHGHPLSGNNLYSYPNSERRACRTCRRLRV